MVKEHEYKASILIVESEPIWRNIFVQILLSNNYRIVAAHSYTEAKRRLDEEYFNVVVTEINLDETNSENIDGMKIIEQIHNSGKPTKGIIVSSHLKHGLTRIALREYGVFDLIEKYPSSGHSFDAENFNKVVNAGVQKSYRNEVLFTSYHPKEGKINTWHTLLVYIHLFSVIEEIRQDAKQFKDQLLTPKEIGSSSSIPIALGTEITIIPTCEGITFNPLQTTVKWMEEWHRADFRFRADNSLMDSAANGYINFLVGPVIVGSLKFALLFSDRNDVQIPSEENSSELGRDKIFISYSHKDTDIALTFKKVHEATGYDVLIDIDDLHSGEEWNPKLMSLIDSADIFQLFWSTNSKESKFCKQEWKHALKRAKEGFIRPVYWQKPLPKPPKELSKYHFEYVDL